MRFTQPIQLQDLFVSKDQPSTTLSRLRTALEGLGFDVHMSDDGIIAEKGSKMFTRFFGAFFVSSPRLPVRIEIEVFGTTPGTSVKTKISDNSGWALRAGLEEVYPPYFRMILDELSKKASLVAFEPTRPTFKLDHGGSRPWRQRLRVVLIFAGVIVCALLLFEFLEMASVFLVNFLRTP